MSVDKPETSRDTLRARLESVLSDHYEIQREVGRGGMGVVFCAFDLRLRRTVAIKLLPPELAFREDIRSRFLREAVSAAQLSHPSIVPIFSVDEREGLVYFVMGFVDGENLAAIVARDGRLPHGRAREIMSQVADALGYAHRRGVVHRDIKPDNIIIDRQTQRAMVTDFGIARAMSDSGSTRLTATGVAIGTPAYMSPEQCAGEKEIDGRSDLYSLGVVGYQMLAGRPPFEASSTPAMLMKHFTEVPTDLRAVLPDIPGDLAAIVMRLLEKKPDSRLQSGEEVVRVLAGGGQAVPAPAPTRRPETMDKRELSGPVSVPAPSAGGGRQAEGKVSKKERRKLKWREKPLTERIRITRSEAMQWIGMSFFLMGINFFTSASFPWFVFPTLGIGLSVWEKVSSLMSEGLRFSDIFGANARRIMASGDPVVVAGGAPVLPDPAERFASREVLQGAHARVVRQAIADYQSIQTQVAKLSAADRERIPEVLETARELFERVKMMAPALTSLDNELDVSKIRLLDERIAEVEREAAQGRDVERKLTLLMKQQASWRDLSNSRAVMYSRFESAALMLENLALDVLKLRSAGLQSVLHEVNSATQEARALIREIGHVVGAADEVRAMDSKSGGDSK